ncbi:hypothetical protein SAMN05421820_101482 [Pedobacter steynii]|uniref:Uncharacterized protein n=1 Tax=Pedobacter steynii TaxID=430522 RepID=A0A1G9K6F2_9SPHI|nr:hypothetical protein [Pedobacter steynii]NQX38461.1 hypothetical protein [Pedobacter steynii]SDL45249.1 hypothetical protein SAMN05421820_101482 [Pedobacter steynii]
MIRIYMDWNVMSQMKAGRHTEFSEIIADKDKFFKLYSTSHIGDIAASNQNESNKVNIDSDLEFIANLTGNYCVFNTGKEVIIEKRSPQELYADKTDLKDILNILDFDISELMPNAEDQEIANLITPALDSLKNLPIDDVFKQAFENPETAAQMKQFLPDLENNYTPAGLFNSLLNMFHRLNEKGDYKQLRTIVQNGTKINRDRLYDTSDPYKMIDAGYQKLGITYPDVTDLNPNAPQWYNQLTNEYLKLDMHGYQEDQVKIDKGRKQTFRNTMEDAFHTAFATTCDFYITSDKKNYKKAQTIYEKLGMNSLVMNPQEFIQHYKDWLHFKGERFLRIIPAILKHVEPRVSEDGNQRTYFGCFFLFDYFNKITHITDNETEGGSFLMLSREKPTNSRHLFGNELDVLIRKLLTVFGNDIEQLDGLDEKTEAAQIREGTWKGRKWIHNKLLYKLRVLNGYLQLYISNSQ